MRFIRWFIKKNQRLSYHIRRSLPSAWLGEDLKLVQDRLVPDLIRQIPGALVLDVGGGRRCHFAKHLEPTDAMLIAVDISPEELQLNEDVSHRVVADAVNGLPFPPDAADLIVSRSVMEHLPNMEGFLAQASQCLRPGGYFINVFPCRFSPFSILNRMLPNRIARAILFYIHPTFRGECGFEAFYDRMYFSKVMELLKSHGFEVIEVRVRYFQSMYYDFFVPFFVISLAYDLLLYFLGARNLAAQLFFVAQKRGVLRESGNSGTRFPLDAEQVAPAGR